MVHLLVHLLGPGEAVLKGRVLPEVEGGGLCVCVLRGRAGGERVREEKKSAPHGGGCSPRFSLSPAGGRPRGGAGRRAAGPGAFPSLPPPRPTPAPAPPRHIPLTSWRRLTDCFLTFRATSSAKASGSDASSTARRGASTGGGAGVDVVFRTAAETGARGVVPPAGLRGAGLAAWARMPRTAARPRADAMLKKWWLLSWGWGAGAALGVWASRLENESGREERKTKQSFCEKQNNPLH